MAKTLGWVAAAMLAVNGGSCGLEHSLNLCLATPWPAAIAREGLLRTRRPEEPSYNRVQRLAGALADRMDAGSIGPVRLKFKIILE